MHGFGTVDRRPSINILVLATVIADFCNKIGTTRTSQDVRAMSAIEGNVLQNFR
jgi:hypothetical protein